MKKLVSWMLVILIASAAIQPVMAAPFVGSIERNPSPQIDQLEDGTDATIYKGDEEVPVGTDDTLELIVTPYGERGEALSEIEDMLDDAHAEVSSVADVGLLTGELEVMLESYKSEHPGRFADDLTTADLYVEDLFDVSLVRNGEEIVDLQPGEIIHFRLKYDNYHPDQPFFVLIKCNGVWKQLNYEMFADGILDIWIDSLCPIMFLKGPDPGSEPQEGREGESREESGNEGRSQQEERGDETISPQTGDNTALYFAGGMVFLTAGAALTARAFRKKRADEQ